MFRKRAAAAGIFKPPDLILLLRGENHVEVAVVVNVGHKHSLRKILAGRRLRPTADRALLKSRRLGAVVAQPYDLIGVFRRSYNVNTAVTVDVAAVHANAAGQVLGSNAHGKGAAVPIVLKPEYAAIIARRYHDI